MWLRASCICILGFLAVPPGQAATVFSERALWTAAAGAGEVVTESFDSPVEAAQIIEISGNVVSANFGDGRYPIDNRVFGGAYENAVDPTNAFASIHVDLLFSKPIRAFGGDWISAGSGGGVIVSPVRAEGAVTGDYRLADTLAAPGTGFWGIGLSDPVSQVRLWTDRENEVFGIDDLSYVWAGDPAPPAPVPLAPGWTFTLLGIAGLYFWTRAQGGNASV